ncbi:Sir2 family NAD-dependent protein deacetylase [Demetria terragena]|uniref:Sir2 family NAD-dependent protein deacetylase n=1 Tax=Demetria terragena TaxID=63959 RepID=UPI000368CC1B|nr:Sir2 family NAD-dependent protein deacetylase [Demetria terragena]
MKWAALVDLVAEGRVCILSGAGLSTESGIPGYRGADGERRVTPMTVSELLASPHARQRYWARSFVGYPRFAAAEPNDGHRAVADLQRLGLTTGIITQNVDGLHQRGGADEIIELHGSLDAVVCVDCGESYARTTVDEWLRQANPRFDREAMTGQIRPDGDVLLTDEQVAGFATARCVVCRSDRLKPDVVMFGESVAKPLVQKCFDTVAESSCLLVLGSSLMVMSGFRFARFAARERIPVAVITQGVTRADAETTVKLESPLGATLTQLVAAVTPGAAPR